MDLSVNHFRAPEERRIGELAYYGEFFANLEFDDGYRSVLYKLLLEYIASYPSPPDISLQIIEDTATRVRVILELTAPNPASLPAITQISTLLQRDFLMQPIRQVYPFHLRDNISLPLIVAAPPESSTHHARYLIQRAESTIISLERELEGASHRIAQLPADDIVMGVLRSQTSGLVSILQDQIVRAKGELSNLIATKYLELAQSPIPDTQATIISPWQADAIIDIGAGGDDEVVSPRMLAWLEQGARERDALKSVIGNLVTQITSLAESVGQAKGVEILHTTGVLSATDAVFDKLGGFLTHASLIRKKSNIAWGEESLGGFDLPGIDTVYHIKNIRSFSGVIQGFDHIDRYGMLQYFYAKGGSYHILNIEGHSTFKTLNFTKMGKFDINEFYTGSIPLAGRFQLADNSWRMFDTLDPDENPGVLSIIEMGGTKSFTQIPKEGILGVYQRADNQMYQCLIEKSDTEQELLQIGDTLFMFKNIIADMSTGTISYLKGWKVYFLDSKMSYISASTSKNIISIAGQERFENMIVSNYDYQDKRPISGKVTTSEGLKKYFYTEGGTYRFLDITGEQEYKNIDIKKSDPDGLPLCFVLENITGKKKCYSINKEGGYYLLQYKGHTEFKEIQIHKIDDKSNRPYNFSLELFDGKKVITQWGNILSFKFIEINSIKPLQLK